jgi:hypothetical protein
VQIALQTKTSELPALDRGAVGVLSRAVASGRAIVSLTSDNVSLLMKINSPFQEVYRHSPGGSSEISSSL